MITVCARWEEQQMPVKVEWHFWRQLSGAFLIKHFVMTPVLSEMDAYHISSFPTMEEALASCTGQRVFLEPTGEKSVAEIPEGDIVLVCGNTANSNLTLSQASERYRVNTPGRTVLFGHDAVAIALAIRYGQ